MILIDLNDLAAAGETRRPAEIMESLGIQYECVEAQPNADQVVFHGCMNLPTRMPNYFRIRVFGGGAWLQSDSWAHVSRPPGGCNNH